MTSLFAIGDIHGCCIEMERAIAHIQRMANPATIVFLGDYIDRGPNSADVVRRLMAGPQRSGDVWHILKGNHEDLCIMAAGGSRQALETWLGNGGFETRKSYGHTMPPEEVIQWMMTLPLTFETELQFFCHAGINPGVPLNEQRELALLWIREPFLSSDLVHPKHIVHGHTIRDLYRFQANRTNLDDGAFLGGGLLFAEFGSEKGAPIAVWRASRSDVQVVL